MMRQPRVRSLESPGCISNMRRGRAMSGTTRRLYYALMMPASESPLWRRQSRHCKCGSRLHWTLAARPQGQCMGSAVGGGEGGALLTKKGGRRPPSWFFK